MTTVHVTFIDAAAGEAFAQSHVPVEQLPESFDAETTLHLGDDDWHVVSAQPAKREEFVRSGTLVLLLRKVEQLDPGDILFSLPSFCDAIPTFAEQTLSGDEFTLADDDWRQVELVSRAHAREVDEEIARIRNVHETASTERGWRRVHVRAGPAVPVAPGLLLSDLARALGAEPRGVALHGAVAPCRDAFAFDVAGARTVYGEAPGGGVDVIAFDQYPDGPSNAAWVERVRTLAAERDLDLVYWNRCVRAGPDDPLFAALLAED